MSADLLLGVDAGQTVTKAVVFDRAGRELGAGSARVAVSSPRPRWVERDMDEVWAATVQAIRDALAAASVDPARVGAVGIVGHNDGLYLIDEHGRPVRPAITAMDTRAAGLLETWQRAGRWPRALALTGQVPYGGSPNALAGWLFEHEPEALGRTAWVLFCKDWLRFGLTGRIATDPTEASAAFTNVRTQAYDRGALALFDLQALQGKLPPLLRSAEVAGEVTDEAARLTGLAPGTPVVTGAHDVDGTALGSGVVEPGRLCIVAGTFSINQVVSTAPTVGEAWQARTFVQPGRWLAMSTSPSSATNLEWWKGILGVRTYDELDAEVRDAVTRDAATRAAQPDAEGAPLYHPFLYGSPYGPDPAAAVVGLRGWHTRGDLIRSIYQGVAFGHRLHVDFLREAFGFDGQPARLTGGAARSRTWSQIFADTLGLPVEIPEGEETGARGAALLAGLGIGAYDDLADAAATVRVARRHDPAPGAGGDPDPARGAGGAGSVDQAYARFLATVEALRHPNDRPAAPGGTQ